jgi:hypothetical protein
VASIGVGRRFEVGLTAPLILSQSDDLGMLQRVERQPVVVRARRRHAHPKVALLDGSVAVAVAAAIGLPTSGGASYSATAASPPRRRSCRPPRRRAAAAWPTSATGCA